MVNNSMLSGGGIKIPLFKVNMSHDAAARSAEILNSGYIGQGPIVDQFERRLKSVLCADSDSSVVTVNSCTSALSLALRMSGIEKGDEVISTAMTCTATNMPIVNAGASIVWGALNTRTGNLDEKLLHESISEKTKALMIVSWAGLPPDMEAIIDFAIKNNLYIIHDAAHSFGAMWNGIGLNDFADFTCYSFQAIKHLTSVDGGCIVLDNDKVERAKKLRWFGMNRLTGEFRCEQEITECGYKYHMNDVNASIGLANLPKAIVGLEKHRINDRILRKELSELNHVTLLDRAEKANSSCWVFTLLVDDVERFMTFMDEHGVVVSRVHARNDQKLCFKEHSRYGGGKARESITDFYNHQVSIPCGWWLSDNDLETITRAVKLYDKDGDN